eukprot:TRINITY_DN8565_c0_g1_i1.p1 TRINITY_DN8565_c0_g1~~TRINITY_DN8565_c0_g1_i1.p1  ORF type:complete len:557 (-),score=79.56 TRINITY_DN8565_c0_g1_i1:53-1723(-)
MASLMAGASCMGFLRCFFGPRGRMSAAFLQEMESARRTRARSHLPILTMMGSVFVIYSISRSFFGNEVIAVFQVGWIAILALQIVTYCLARWSPWFLGWLDVAFAFTCIAFFLVNSMTNQRMKQLFSPAFDHVVIESYEPAGEVVSIFSVYVCLVASFNMHMFNGFVGAIVCASASLLWLLAAWTLGTVFPDMMHVFVLHFLTGVVTFLGFKKNRDTVLALQWELYGLGNQKQQAATSSIMDYLCDCVCLINSSFELLTDCPKLASILFLLRAKAVRGSRFLDFLAPDQEAAVVTQRFQEKSESGSAGVIPLRLLDASARPVSLHAYHSSFEDEEGGVCYVLGIVEDPEQTRTLPEVSANASHTVLASTLGHPRSPAASNASEKSNDSESAATLGNVIASEIGANQHMRLTVDTSNMEVVMASQGLTKFLGGFDIGKADVSLTQCLRQSQCRKVEKKLTELRGLLADRKFGSLRFKLPTKIGAALCSNFHDASSEGGPAPRKVRTVLDSSQCELGGFQMVDISEDSVEESVMLADIEFLGEVRLIESNRPPRSSSH